ncbi:unnamed protein product [Kuraishia capsulata CBS 1993]|uniref:Prefoldin subunit 3 n=1 Tax=Kuraishia capsulata CBS 1993 TaxID=1382522 RepID=W6MWU8_9ASCO|nr:uncharacterized protein KUCA_T00003870001 [Kuraishia capsulata CBS 1993]CDK27890.1 unnamed protein product [Kuraishia capsulata CBS 1993]
MDRLKTDITNPRGIPQAKFIDNVSAFVKSDDDVTRLLQECEERLNQYRFMESNKKETLRSLRLKVPDIDKSLAMVRFLQTQKKTGNEEFDLNYELNDTLYSTASVDVENLDSVCLWLGADVMLEYPLDEAIELLEGRLKTATESLDITKEDLEYLRENITTMEVNTARVYNYDVARRKVKA